MTLQEHLGKIYSRHVLHGNPLVQVVQPLKQNMAESSELAEQVRMRFSELKSLDDSLGGQLAKRCFVSNVQKQALEEALR